MPGTLRIAVLASLQALDDRAQLPVSGGLVVLERLRFTCYGGEASREAGAAPRGEYPPGKLAVRSLEPRVFPVEKTFQRLL